MSLPDLCVIIVLILIKQYVLDFRKFVYKQQIYMSYTLLFIYAYIYICMYI